MKKINIIFCLLFVNLIIAHGQIDSNVIRCINERVDSGYVPSIIVGVIDSKLQTVFYSYGYKSFEQKESVDENTIYKIGSDTKTFTSTLLSILISEEELSLDDLLIDFLPDSIKNKIKGYDQITLKDLATHTSGLPRNPYNLTSFEDYSEREMFEHLLNNDLVQDSIKKVSYSNFGVGLLGYVMEIKTGKSYEDLLKKYICGEFRLNNTTITLSDEMKNNMAKPYSGNYMAKNTDMKFFHGAGAIRSTANDLLIYLSYQLGLKPTKYREAIDKTHIDYYKKNDVSYCLGWIHNMQYKNDFYSHGGRTKGYNSFVGFNKDKKIGVVVLCNNSSYHCGDIGFYVLSMKESKLDSIDEFKERH